MALSMLATAKAKATRCNLGRMGTQTNDNGETIAEAQRPPDSGVDNDDGGDFGPVVRLWR